MNTPVSLHVLYKDGTVRTYPCANLDTAEALYDWCVAHEANWDLLIIDDDAHVYAGAA